MDEQTQLAALDRFLTSIYGEETHLTGMLNALGFNSEQTRLLHEDCLPGIAQQFIDAIHRKLKAGEKDLWFRLLSRRFGLDGEPGVSLDEAAPLLGIDREYASQAESDALQKCRYKTTLQDFRKELHRIALAALSKGAVPQKDQIARKLTRLADLRAAVDLTRMDYKSKRAEVLQKVQAELDVLESEYQPLLDAAQENASALESEIKNDVLLGGQSVITDFYQALYMKGRVTWDNDGIDKYAQSHPEVLKYRKVGQPSVALHARSQGPSAPPPRLAPARPPGRRSEGAVGGCGENPPKKKSVLSVYPAQHPSSIPNRESPLSPSCLKLLPTMVIRQSQLQNPKSS